MFVKLGGPSAATGGSSPVKLATAPNTDGSVQVGVFEELAGGTGSQWRAGVWVSAFVAANTLGKDLTDFTFRASSGGYIDGASASGLMAGGFLATMTGATIDPTATMTGIINPDGTIGPVAGIPEKFKAAIDKGKKRLGYPIGMRWARSEATGELVDLVQLAKDAAPRRSRSRTSTTRTSCSPASSCPSRCPSPRPRWRSTTTTNKALDAKYKRVAEAARRASGRRCSSSSRPADCRAGSIARWRATRRRSPRPPRSCTGRACVAAAYSQHARGVGVRRERDRHYDILQKVQAGDIPAAIAALDEARQARRRPRSTLFKKIGAMRPATMGGHMLMMARVPGRAARLGLQGVRRRRASGPPSATSSARRQAPRGAAVAEGRRRDRRRRRARRSC